MPSVDATWSGRLRDRQLQQDLCEHVSKLSDISNHKFEEYFGMTVYSTLFTSTEVGINYLGFNGTFGSNVESENLVDLGDSLYLVKGLGLFGVDFPLYDPRNFTSMFPLRFSNQMSFVFTRSEDPDLDGFLVRPKSTDQWYEKLPVDGILLTTPMLDLRYYLETWTSTFLGWVKHFYMPDLYYWLYGDHSLYHKYNDVEPNDEQKEIWFEKLLQGFSEEAESFTNLIKSFHQKPEDGE